MRTISAVRCDNVIITHCKIRRFAADPDKRVQRIRREPSERASARERVHLNLNGTRQVCAHSTCTAGVAKKNTRPIKSSEGGERAAEKEEETVAVTAATMRTRQSSWAVARRRHARDSESERKREKEWRYMNELIRGAHELTNNRNYRAANFAELSGLDSIAIPLTRARRHLNRRSSVNFVTTCRERTNERTDVRTYLRHVDFNNRQRQRE